MKYLSFQYYIVYNQKQNNMSRLVNSEFVLLSENDILVL